LPGEFAREESLHELVEIPLILSGILQFIVCVLLSGLQKCDRVFCLRVSLLRCVVMVIHRLPGMQDRADGKAADQSETAVACFNPRSELRSSRGHYPGGELNALRR
jgi:hypothetical protein